MGFVGEECLKERILLAISAARRSSYGVALARTDKLKLHGFSENEINRIVSGGLPDGPEGALVAVARNLILKPMEFPKPRISKG